MQQLTLFYHFTKVAGHRSLEQIIEAIKGNHFKAEVAQIRLALQRSNKPKADKLKKLLPAFTPSGNFNGGRTLEHLVEYTQLVILDFDKLEKSQLEGIKKEARQDRFASAGFTSPSGCGYKLIARVDSAKEHHEAAFRQVAKYYTELLSPHMGGAGGGLDRSGKDITRLCFLSHDPEAWFDFGKEVFPVLIIEADTSVSTPAERRTTAANGQPAARKNPSSSHVELQGIFAETQNHSDYAEGNRNNFLYLFANNANRSGVAEADTLDFALENFSDLPRREVIASVASAYKHHAVEHGASSQKGTSTEEFYTQLHNTPIFPDEIFPDLPALLLEPCALLEDTRERDVFLTAAISILSGCIPATKGVYDRREFYPNLYSFILAPPASSKSVMTFAKHLGNGLHKSLKEQSKTAFDKYKKDLIEYNRRQSRLLKSKKTAALFEATEENEPVKPPVKLLFIPANTSAAMFRQHLADNGGSGILCETEADTLGNVLQQDWGKYSDLMRKCFSHEDDANSRKSVVEFMELESPRLSIALSGTPNQVLRLIPSSEDGLFSRFLFYIFAVKPHWRDVSPQQGSVNLTEYFREKSQEVVEMYNFLAAHPTEFHFSRTQWTHHFETFQRLLKETFLLNGDDALASVFRMGVIFFRMAMTFSALRKFERRDTTTVIYCSETDYETVQKLANVFIQHTLFLLEKLPKTGTAAFNNLPNNKRLFIENLPPEFRRKDAVEVGERYGVSRATVDRMLETFTGSYFDCAQHGVYSKR
ncbi:MAG: DUF3987 domain-containing protein [Bacteroidetes bacterium]|nr:DUF3987 domain-containing protein [Bacteroidota bacterium]